MAPEQDPPARGARPTLSSYWIETWGCQMNEHDSEKMAGVLGALGLQRAEAEEQADVILLNTCSVREKAAHKIFSRLGELRQHKAQRPHVLLGVCGCVAQQEQEAIFRRAPFVDLVMGPRRIGALPDLIAQAVRNRRAIAVIDPKDSLVSEDGPARRVSRTRAWVTVMEGCNKTCTFCIVPATRGREACRTPQSILQEVRTCVQEGLVEVELLGQNVNAWRYAGEDSWDFARLLASVAGVDGVRRVRFTTSHPLHFRDPIIETMAAHETICRYLHLPAQSGSDRVLALMRRGYTRDDYLRRIERLRQRIPDIALSTDLIVGFPGESEEDFQRTLDLVEQVGFDSIFSFLYSPRPETPAVGLVDDIAPAEKKQRLHRLQQLQARREEERRRGWEGRVVEVLVDGPSPRASGQLSGRTTHNQIVNFDGSPQMVGRLVDVRIDRAGPHSLHGSLKSP